MRKRQREKEREIDPRALCPFAVHIQSTRISSGFEQIEECHRHSTLCVCDWLSDSGASWLTLRCFLLKQFFVVVVVCSFLFFSLSRLLFIIIHDTHHLAWNRKIKLVYYVDGYTMCDVEWMNGLARQTENARALNFLFIRFELCVTISFCVCCVCAWRAHLFCCVNARAHSRSRFSFTILELACFNMCIEWIYKLQYNMLDAECWLLLLHVLHLCAIGERATSK